MNPFGNAWQLLKELDTQDLQQAARTGGIGMTPERRQAYTDAGLPLSTGGGFRTMSDTEAQRMMRYQRTDSPEGMVFPVETTIGHDAKNNLADYLHQDLDTGGSLGMDDRLLDDYFKLTQGDSIEDPSLEQGPPRIGRGKRLQGENVHSMEFDRNADFPGRGSYVSPAPGVTGGLVPMEDAGYGARNRDRYKTRITRPVGFPGEYGSRRVQEIRKPSPYEVLSDILANKRRNQVTPLPEGHQGPEQFPASEFARRGDAGASASDQAFTELKRRQQQAEAERQMLVERQEEMKMRQQQARVQSRQPKQGAGGRRPGEGKNAYRNRMNRQGGRR